MQVLSPKLQLRSVLRSAVVLLVAMAVWLPLSHFCFRPKVSDWRQKDAVAPEARRMLADFQYLWQDEVSRDRELALMAQMNPEWDFMSRTFLVMALANAALQNPTLKTEALVTMDTIIDHTLQLEREGSFYHFLLGYAHGGPWMVQPPRSQFVDGEVAMMLAARRLVEERADYREELQTRVATMIARMEASPVLSAESYPDECWTFCNAIGVAAIRAADALDGSDHRDFLERWMKVVREKLTDQETGLLIAAYTVDGTPHPAGDGPEGTTIWLVANMLEVIDPAFAEDQYKRARHELGRSLLGYGFAREWPVSHRGSVDIDSGPVIPIIDASASSSGLAILGAAAFDDNEYLRQLLTSLRLGAFPLAHEDRLSFRAADAIGNSVVLYALVEGPLWHTIKERTGL